ncbi:MAG: hypothetical protein LBE82_05350 [Chitinophagaceae bacterium]|jgi:hypothetical protein|nr:hypothetical protein [Chitinophagaceae bacterium]
MVKELWNYVSNKNITEDMDELSAMQAKIINQYAFLLPVIIIIDSVRDWIFDLPLNAIFLFCIGCVLLLLFLFTKVRFNTILVVLCCFGIAVFIFYYSAMRGIESEVYLNYFALLSSVVFIFNGKKTVTVIIAFYIVVYILFHIGNIYNFEIFQAPPAYKNILHAQNSNLRIVTVTQVFIVMAFNAYFITKKNSLLSRLYGDKLKAEQIISEIRKKIDTSNSTNIEEIVKMAMNNEIAFIPQFKQHFPNFYIRLEQIKPDMTTDEFKFCALLKLGFSTKDISQYTHTTIRSVQTRKNRLRKSFNIPSETDLYKWIDGF